MQEVLHVPDGTPLAKVVEKLEQRSELPPLAPKRPWSEELQGTIRELKPETMLGGAKVASPNDAVAVLAGLLLWNDSLSASHTISQGILTETGSYWHGIMHRREPDYSNSKH